MKKIYILLFALAAAVGMTGCTSEMPEKTATEGGDIVIRLQVDGLETKSAGTSDENYVESLQLLIFKDINTAPSAYLNPSITAGGGPFEQTYANVAALAAGITGADLKTATIFAVANCSTNLSTAGITSLANAKAVAVDAAAMVSNTSEGYKVNASPRFVMTAEGGFEVGTGADAGKAVASLLLKRLASKVSLTITYDQDLSDPDNPTLITTANADGTTTVWTPMTEGNVRVYLQNAVSNATLGGFATSQTRFTYADVQPAGEPLTASAFYTYPPKWDEGSDDAPFIKIIQPWSYKTMKDDGTPGDPKPVVVDESTVELYYKVMFPGMTELAGNTDYQFEVKLTVLGGESTRDMKEITPTGFSILPWGATTSSDLSPIVSETPKYLAVERKSTVTSNGAGVSIKYVASGPATLTVNSIIKHVYSNTGTVDKHMYPADTDIADKYTGGTVAAGSSDAWFENNYGTDPEKPNEGTITLKHTLSSALFDDTITNFAARPYEYDLTLHLDSESNSDLDQSFHITQNPPFLVTGEKSTGYVNIDNQTSPFGSIYRKRTSLDPLISTTAEDFDAELGTSYYINPLYRNNLYDYDRLRKDQRLGNTYTYIDLTRNASTGNSQTSNLCEYRIIVSMAAVEGKFIVDPRVESSAEEDLDKIINKHKSGYSTTIATDNNYLDKDGNPLSTEATDISNIAKYKPASKSEAAKNFIAPEIMFASSYGRTGTLTYEEAVLRCLAYQEDGYPAGRWRLPTEAEISMCIQLQKRGTIPELFRTNVTLTGAYRYSGGYSAASGNRYIEDAFHPYANAIYTVSSQDRAICAWPRCVYDTWYWGREEVEALKDGTYTEAGVNYQKYKWSGYGYTSKE